jgi:hypothetical protein
MNLENRLLIELKDVEAVEFECRKCHGKIIRRIEGFKLPPITCGNCETQLLIPGSRECQELAAFLQRIAEIAKDEGEPFSLKLQIRGNV